MNRLTEREIIQKLESAIMQLGSEFQGDKAFYFYKEEDIRCRLYVKLSRNLRDCDIIHAEQYKCSDNRYFDLVVWRPSLKQKAMDKLWGPDYAKIEEIIPELTLVAVEIIALYGGTKIANKFAEYNTCKHDDDIAKLIQSMRRKTTKHAYILLFWDDDVMGKSDLQDCARKMSAVFQKLERKEKIRSCCVSRDSGNKCVFAWGFRSARPARL